jgi:arsenate reductase (thioredoxin)
MPCDHQRRERLRSADLPCEPGRRPPQAGARGIKASLVLLLAALSLQAGCAAPAQVVFVCEHGAAKSVVAAAYFNEAAAARGLPARAIARGATPQESLSESAAAGLRADGLTAGLAAPLPLTADDVRRSVRIVTFDCAEPAMQGLRAMGDCWADVPATGSGYAAAREAIRAHVGRLVEGMARQSPADAPVSPRN